MTSRKVSIERDSEYLLFFFFFTHHIMYYGIVSRLCRRMWCDSSSGSPRVSRRFSRWQKWQCSGTYMCRATCWEFMSMSKRCDSRTHAIQNKASDSNDQRTVHSCAFTRGSIRPQGKWMYVTLWRDKKRKREYIITTPCTIITITVGMSCEL